MGRRGWVMRRNVGWLYVVAAVAMPAFSGCVTDKDSASEPQQKFIRIDGQSLDENPRLQAQMQADGRQCLAHAHMQATGIANPPQPSVTSNIVVLEQRGYGRNDLQFLDRPPARVNPPSTRSGDPRTLEIVVNACMVERGYVLVNATGR